MEMVRPAKERGSLPESLIGVIPRYAENLTRWPTPSSPSVVSEQASLADPSLAGMRDATGDVTEADSESGTLRTAWDPLRGK